MLLVRNLINQPHVWYHGYNCDRIRTMPQTSCTYAGISIGLERAARLTSHPFALLVEILLRFSPRLAEVPIQLDRSVVFAGFAGLCRLNAIRR